LKEDIIALILLIMLMCSFSINALEKTEGEKKTDYNLDEGGAITDDNLADANTKISQATGARVNLGSGGQYQYNKNTGELSVKHGDKTTKIPLNKHKGKNIKVDKGVVYVDGKVYKGANTIDREGNVDVVGNADQIEPTPDSTAIEIIDGRIYDNGDFSFRRVAVFRQRYLTIANGENVRSESGTIIIGRADSIIINNTFLYNVNNAVITSSVIEIGSADEVKAGCNRFYDVKDSNFSLRIARYLYQKLSLQLWRYLMAH